MPVILVSCDEYYGIYRIVKQTNQKKKKEKKLACFVVPLVFKLEGIQGFGMWRKVMWIILPHNMSWGRRQWRTVGFLFEALDHLMFEAYSFFFFFFCLESLKLIVDSPESQYKDEKVLLCKKVNFVNVGEVWPEMLFITHNRYVIFFNFFYNIFF